MGMGKTKKNKKDLVTIKASVGMSEDSEAYDSYLKDHNRKMRRLARELSGENMESPPDKDY